MNLLNEIQHDIVGVAILKDWLGDGGETVSAPRAEARAFVCLNCPWHNPSNWWTIHFKEPIARAIRRTLEYKNKANLKLSCEDRIGECDKCKCCLRLKAWVPIEHVDAHTNLGDLNEYPDFCWIKREILELKGTP
jgi:hypothetical protein